MAALTTQNITSAGATITVALSNASDTAEIGSGTDTFLLLRNGTAGTITWTIQVPGTTFFGLATQDNAVAVPANTDRYVMLRKEYDDGTGRATITVTPAANVSIAVGRVG